VDAAVHQGANLPLDREVFRLMNRDSDGRKTFVTLLCGIAARGSIEKIDRDIKYEVNSTFAKSFVKFSADWVTLQRVSKPSVLHDFSPAGSVAIGGVWSGNTLLVTRYDIARMAGNHGLPTEAQPSNPKAFYKPPIKAPSQPSGVVSATLLARTIGLTAGDRKFLADALAEGVKRINKPKVSSAILARRIFEGPSFEDVLGGGELPEREDFKDRFVAGLDEALEKGYGLAAGSGIQRADYASGPNSAPLTATDRHKPKLVPTTACMGCHAVLGAAEARFVEPLPALAFDPFDKPGREAWLKAADKKRKQAVLGRLLKRVAVDKDMPPEDATEYELFRTKDAASFDEVKQFLETALKKAKGN